SMRIIGQVKGALTTVATRRSVIFSSDGLEFVLTFLGYASVGSAVMKALPSAAAEDFNTPRRSIKCRSGVLMANPFLLSPLTPFPSPARGEGRVGLSSCPSPLAGEGGARRRVRGLTVTLLSCAASILS